MHSIVRLITGALFALMKRGFESLTEAMKKISITFRYIHSMSIV